MRSSLSMKFLVGTSIVFLFLGMVDMQPSHQSTDPNKCMMLRTQKPSITSLDNVCYYISQTELPWMGALNYCLNSGMILAELATVAEFNSVILLIVGTGSIKRYWFGANKLDEESDFTYVGSGKKMQYLSKKHVIDNMAGNELCFELRMLDGDFVMNDDSCKKKHLFICQARDCYCDGASARTTATTTEYTTTTPILTTITETRTRETTKQRVWVEKAKEVGEKAFDTFKEVGGKAWGTFKEVGEKTFGKLKEVREHFNTASTATENTTTTTTATENATTETPIITTITENPPTKNHDWVEKAKEVGEKALSKFQEIGEKAFGTFKEVGEHFKTAFGK